MMIKEASIANYKGIKECKIQDLRRVNLFIGKNDSGKSSILEAIFHTLKEGMGSSLNGIMRRRTDVFTGGRELWFRYNTGLDIGTSLIFNRLNIHMRIGMEADRIKVTFAIIPKARPNVAEEIRASEYHSANFDVIHRRTAIRESSRFLSKQNYGELLRYAGGTVFIDSGSKSRLTDLEANLGEIKLAGKDEEFGVILDNIYGKGKIWEFLPHADNPKEKRVAVREYGQRFFLSDFGDGFRYGLTMCATAMTRERTGIFIEEIESHQHAGSLRNLVPSLVSISRKNNLQLFITTHSSDVWNSFARGVYVDDVKREKEEFRCFIVERDTGTGKVTAETTDDIPRITRELGRT